MNTKFDIFNLEERPIDPNILHYSFNLFGVDGSGKTTFLIKLMNKLGKVAVLGFEDRFKGIPGFRGMEFKSWDDYESFKKQLKKGLKDGKKLPYDCINVDTVGEAAKMYREYIMEENGWSELKGDQYNVVGNGFVDEIRQLRDLGLVVNFVSHDKSKTFPSPSGDEIQKLVPDAMNQIKHLVQGDVDFILYLEECAEKDDEGQEREFRRLWIHGHGGIKLKTALYGMPNYIDFYEVDEGVEKFIKAFNKAVKITQKMQDDGVDVSNPNADNLEIIDNSTILPSKLDEEEKDDEAEVVENEKTTEKESVEEDGFDDEEELPEQSLEELQQEAMKVRKSLQDKGHKTTEVKQMLIDILGTFKPKEVTDINKLKEFIEKYQ